MKTPISKYQKGFSTLEMLIVIAVSVIISAIAIPEYLAATRYMRIAGDLRDINGITAQAKMRAASAFTRARIYADLANNTFQLQVWAKTGGSAPAPGCPTCAFVSLPGTSPASSGGTGCWVADQDPAQNCITFTGSAPSGPGVVQLGQGDSYGYGTLTAGPTPGQATISQAPNCYPGAANAPDGGSSVTNSACIEFNSRGVPVDNNSNPVNTGALYITNGNVVEGVTASATGSIQTWQCAHGQTSWMGQ
jgi:prepilin-type N-terminal cleavage/methylation domain-containing protein